MSNFLETYDKFFPVFGRGFNTARINYFGPRKLETMFEGRRDVNCFLLVAILDHFFECHENRSRLHFTQQSENVYLRLLENKDFLDIS